MADKDIAAIVDRVRLALSRRHLRSLVEDLRGYPDATLFAALFPIAVRTQGRGRAPVAMSAYVLQALNPACPLPVDEAVAALLPDWDISLKEVVEYLVTQFGANALRASTYRLAESRLPDKVKFRLTAIESWVAECVSRKSCPLAPMRDHESSAASRASVRQAFADAVKSCICPACGAHFTDASIAYGDGWREGYVDRIREEGFDIRDGPYKLKCEACDRRSWYNIFSKAVTFVDDTDQSR